MIPSLLMQEGEEYICSIRNSRKREYARAYLDFMVAHPASWRNKSGPEANCSTMAAQAVRMNLADIAKQGE